MLTGVARLPGGETHLPAISGVPIGKCRKVNFVGIVFTNFFFYYSEVDRNF